MKRPVSVPWSLLAFVAYRATSTFVVNTYFVPDEYWQSLEVAHKATFGYGYLTWEWRQAIRSYFYPLCVSAVYHILKALDVDTVYLLTTVPRLLQAALYGVGDYYVYKLASSMFGRRAGFWTAFCLVTAWFPFYCASRTLTNTAEAALSALVYYQYPWKKPSLKRRRACNYLWAMGASCLVRPTSAIMWAALCTWHLCRLGFKDALKQAIGMFRIGVIFCAVQIGVDYYGYGYFVFTPLRFLGFNWFRDIGAFYGTHSLHWYFAVGFPVVMATNVVPFLLGVRIPQLRPFVDLIAWGIVVLSFLQHKEFRFLLPLVPLALCVSGVSIDSVLRSARWRQNHWMLVKGIVLSVTLIVNVPLTLYVSVRHQRGTLDVMKFIEGECWSRNDKTSVVFLMPCHSTPFYSFLHRHIPMDFLTCEPNLDDKVPDYKDEADLFYEDPTTWLSAAWNQTTVMASPPYTHVVMFDCLYPRIADIISRWKYRLCYETFHTDFPTERVGRYVQVYCSMS